MKDNRKSIDGLMTKRPSGARRTVGIDTPKKTEKIKSEGIVAREGKDEIDDFLSEIKDESPADLGLEVKKRHKKEKHGPKAPKKKWKKIVAAIVIVLILGSAGVAVWALTWGNSVISKVTGGQGGIFDILKPRVPLKKDKNGRTNVLVFGTEGYSMDNSDHPGAQLTDSILVLSLDEEHNDAAMFSLPRDLITQKRCTATAKLNETYWCTYSKTKNETAGAEALEAQVEEITGLTIQYFVHLNWGALEEVVDAIGGIEVTIESSDSRGILDRNFDWECNFKCYYVKYANGEVAQLDGKHALALARARNAQGGYGLAMGNFDREKNQQKIISAIQKKVVENGFNLDVFGLINTIGDNVRFNFAVDEIKSLVDVGKDLDLSTIRSLPLLDYGKGVKLVTTGSVNGISYVLPTAGTYDYTKIHEYFAQQLDTDAVKREGAIMDVLNGTKEAGVARAVADKLESEGYKVGKIDNAPEGKYKAYEIYQMTDKAPETAKMLNQKFGVTIQEKDKLPRGITSSADFVIIVGVDPDANKE
jgi:LCP family protein required for cell wall assembly